MARFSASGTPKAMFSARLAENRKVSWKTKPISAQLLRLHAADIHAVDEDAALAGIVKAGQQPDQRRFAAARGADQGHVRPGPDVQAHTLQDGLIVVAEHDVLEDHAPAALGHGFRLLGRLDLRPGVEDLEDALSRDEAVLQGRGHAGDHLHVARQHARPAEDRVDHADGDGPVQRPVRRDRKHRQQAQLPNVEHRRLVDGEVPGQEHVAAQDAVDGLVVAFLLLRLAPNARTTCTPWTFSERICVEWSSSCRMSWNMGWIRLEKMIIARA